MNTDKSKFENSATAELARRLGVELDYINAAHQQIIIIPEVVRAVLKVIGYSAENDIEARHHLNSIDEQEHLRKLPPVLVLREERQPARIPVKLTHGKQSYRWRLIQEDGEIAEQGTLNITQRPSAGPQPGDESRSAVHPVVLNRKLPCGYHRFEIDDAAMSLIVVPEKCWLEPIEGGRKVWGIATQLYLLRSTRNWGIGDFTDLGSLLEIAGGWGASVIGLNPLHALFLDDPEQASPYSPVSRLYLNILNIDVTAIAEFSASENARSLLNSQEVASALDTLRAADKVNYREVAALKLRMLRLLYRDFATMADDERRRALEMFVHERGESLKQYCTFQAIRLELAQNHAAESQPWPEEFRHPDSPGTRRFVASHCEEIDFLIWTQWIADEQLREASRRASAQGLRIGLYRDLAVGSSGEGAETWSNPSVVVAAAHAGAPPDLLNPAGQDWGLPPFNPRTLYEAAYTPFIELVRANMRYSGAIRIDHVLGLQHLYWVPAGHPPTQGTYVTYPFEDLVGILSLESQRNHCMVIGEDLGTVPPGFSKKLNERGILSYRVLYFEQDADSDDFIPPREYPWRALATIGSHDLATLKGWWLGNDIKIREQHNLYPDPQEAGRQRSIRDREKRQLLAALIREGLDPVDANDFNRLSRSVHAFLARSSAALVMIQLEDLTAEESQTNLPATSREHPNWRRRLSKSLEQLAKDPDLASVIDIVRRERLHS